MAIDWLNTGFNIVIGTVIMVIISYWVFRFWKQIVKTKGEDNEEELDRLLKIQKLMRKK